ncbi:ABC transporter substrate-binding protein [Sphingosinicella sp. CPCC 101087]|uniref:ABC transporter substrate-binding protein n=1 Tax=Sphingosinicella sp. CPCC 101087 TaxID=2497754 RepID=UPI0013EDA2D7|nr:ABC transporter substrate-binding protein [Sphingosinicella sp. CPCC 101087]
MRVFASLSAISLALAAPALAEPAAAAPRRVASLNLCTDELVLALAAPDQIVSVTHLAQQAAETSLWRQAQRYRRNDGSLLSVAALRPDLVVTMGGGARDRLRIAERLGIATLDLPFPLTLDDVARSVRMVARALGRPAAGGALLRRMAALRATAPAARTDTIWLGGGGRTYPAQGLAAQWMALAGLRQRPVQGDRVPLETLIARPPQVLLRSDYRSGQFSAEQRWLNHPAARRARGSRTIVTDGRPWTCLGPAMIDEIERLRSEAAR